MHRLAHCVDKVVVVASDIRSASFAHKSWRRFLDQSNDAVELVCSVDCDDVEGVPSSDSTIQSRSEQLSWVTRRFRKPRCHSSDIVTARFSSEGTVDIQFRAGAHRNRQILLNIGARLQFTDCDQSAQYVLPMDHEPDERSESEPNRYFSYSPEIGPFASTHESLSLVDFHDRLMSGSDRVVATFAGVAGDLGFVSPVPLLLLTGANRERLFLSGAGYEENITKRTGSFGVKRSVFSSTPLFRAGSCALDTTRFLPPFSPVGRGEDAVFGELVYRMYGPGSIGVVPVNVEHFPKDLPPFSVNDLENVAPRFNDLLVLCLQAMDEYLEDDEPAARLSKIGRHLKRVSKLSRSDYRDFIRHRFAFVTDALEATFRLISERERTASALWDSHVEKFLSARRAYAESRGVGMAADLVVADDHVAGRTSQSLISRFAESLMVWPDVWKACA